jgi:N-methylhydantoinase A
VSDVIKDYSRTVLKVVASPAGKRTVHLPKPFVDDIELQFRALRGRAERDFASEGWSGKLEIVAAADVRYRGQGFELNIPWGRNLPSLFASEHKRRYGYADESRAIEIVTLRLRAHLKSKTPSRPSQRRKTDHQPQNAKIWLDGKRSVGKIYDRESLTVNRWYRGPAIITEYSATTAIPANMRFTMSPESNLVIETAGKAKATSAKTKGAPNRSARL